MYCTDGVAEFRVVHSKMPAKLGSKTTTSVRNLAVLWPVYMLTEYDFWFFWRIPDFSHKEPSFTESNAWVWCLHSYFIIENREFHGQIGSPAILLITGQEEARCPRSPLTAAVGTLYSPTPDTFSWLLGGQSDTLGTHGVHLPLCVYSQWGTHGIFRPLLA